MRYQGGAFPGTWAMLGCMTAFACYDIKNNKTIGWDVVVNRPKVAAYRAPSAPMAAFAVESTIDLVAKEIGKSPIDVRLKNVAREGTQAPLRAHLWADWYREYLGSGESPSTCVPS